MSERQQSRDLELKPDEQYERIEWRVQRFGWCVLFLLCGSALAGLLGRGPVSKQRAGTVDSALYLEYDRYLRHHAPTSLKIFCQSNGGEDLTVSFQRAYVQAIQIERIQPEPDAVVAAGERFEYRFKSGDANQQGVTIYFEPDNFGALETEVTLNGNSARQIKQFVWP